MRRYLLGQLEAADEERLELRLLTDPAFTEQFDTIVDEITDQYVRNEFHGAERERVEKYFLNSAERQNKVKFAHELLHRAAVERGREVEKTTVQHEVKSAPGLLDGIQSFLSKLSFAQFATTTAALIVVAGVLFFLMRPGSPSSGSYASLNLTISGSNRSASAAPAPVKLQPGISGLRLNLSIPTTQVAEANSYRVKLIGDDAVERDLGVVPRNDRSVTVEIPATQLRRGSYAIQLSAVNADGTDQRIGGSYFFTIE